MRRVNISYPILRQTLLKTFQPIPLTNIRSRPAKHRAPLITTISGYWITVNQLVRSIYIYARYLSRSIARLIDIGFVNFGGSSFPFKNVPNVEEFRFECHETVDERERERERSLLSTTSLLFLLFSKEIARNWLAGWLVVGWWNNRETGVRGII